MRSYILEETNWQEVRASHPDVVVFPGGPLRRTIIICLTEQIITLLPGWQQTVRQWLPKVEQK
jgi:hypothetical protein